jgi:hypothetical protein
MSAQMESIGLATRWLSNIARAVRRRPLAFGLIALVMLLIAGPAAADKRVALVVGNSAYQHVAPLDNPADDASSMADALRGAGFTLVGGAALTECFQRRRACGEAFDRRCSAALGVVLADR